MSCDKNKFYDWFKLNCILLILAVNQIPSGVMEYGYLYHLDIDIDKEQLSRYVSEQEACLKQVEEYLENVGDNLQRMRKTGDGYIEDTGFDDSLEECRRSMHNDREIKKLQRKDLGHEAQLYGKLDINRREVHARLYFPKGLLREEAARIQDRVEKKPGAGEFLSAAGEDLLERKMWEKLEEICKKKRVPLKQTEYERDYEKREEAVRRCAQKKMKPWFKFVSCILLSVLEMVIIMPFLHYSIHMAQAAESPAENKLYQMMEKLGLLKMPWSWPGILLIWLLVWAVCAFFVFILVYGLSLLSEIVILCTYHGHVFKRIINRQEQRIEYYEEMVNLLAEYQYCIRLLREQRKREQDWEKKRAKLQYHRNAWKQNSVVCRQLKFFAEPEERFANPAIASFDILDDPRQIEYYWTPFRESRWQAELNRSGLYIRGIFRFVTRVHITKTICYEPLNNQ